ncbi:MAG: response regulator [Candidatus Cloacimonetes bacterium]|jgi:two-component system cell cycle sensor histidine kinase/response regulator CckA|nr:response regulator [Candidatus Cloacimonadota bacterium]
MAQKRLLIVEDERIIAEDIKKTLLHFGYNVIEIISYGEIVLERYDKLNPDLILMDIMLAGKINGIETASRIKEKHRVPIIYLTAYANEPILGSAKITEPFGYLIKTLEENEQHATIEMAFYRYKIENTLRQSEEKYRLLFKSIADPIFIITDDGEKFFDCNDVVLNKYGYTKEELTSSPATKLYIKEEHEQLAHYLKAKNPDDSPIFTHISKNGEKIIVELHKSKIFFKNEKVLLIIARDITKRKQAEDEKRTVLEQLFQSQKMEVVGKLAGGIAHDFNNLLTAINGYADLALRKIDNDSNAYSDIKVIKDCGERAARLTKQLLGFSRKQIAEKTNIDLNSTITELEKMLNRLIGNDISLKTNFQSPLCMIYADKSQIEQVLVNLVVNARDAIVGHGKIVVSTTEELLTEEFIKKHDLDVSNKYIMISVADTGVGMSEEIQKKIFDPFFTTKDVDKGTGLGLSTVFGIVKQNNGIILVESVEGKGSELKIYLPQIIAETIEDKAVKNEPQDLPTGNETILLVDDEESIRDFLSEIIEEQGYKVIKASNGKKGLRKFKEINDKIHLLISDITMPEMSGPELANELRELQPDIKAIFISGNADENFIQEQSSNSNVSFLQKPFTFDSIISKIREILDDQNDEIKGSYLVE